MQAERRHCKAHVHLIARLAQVASGSGCIQVCFVSMNQVKIPAQAKCKNMKSLGGSSECMQTPLLGSLIAFYLRHLCHLQRRLALASNLPNALGKCSER